MPVVPEVPEVAAVPPEPSLEPEPERLPDRRRWAVPVTAVLALLFVGASAVALVQWRRADDLRAGEDERRAVASAAGRFGQALLSYDFDDLTTARGRVLALATDRFAKEYTTAFTGGLDDAITKLQARSQASVRDVYVTDVIGDSARAVVTLDSEVRSTAGTRRTVSSYLDMTLVRQGGRWRIDTVTSVAALDQKTTSATTSTTSTTSTTR